MADSKTSEEEARQYAESILNTVREPLIVLDQDLRVISASRSFYETFKVSPEETEGRLVYDLSNKQWDIPKLRELLETLLPRNTSIEGYEVEHEFAGLGRRNMLINAREIRRKSGKERLVLLAIEDVTRQKQSGAKLAEQHALLEAIYKNAPLIMMVVDGDRRIRQVNGLATQFAGRPAEEMLGLRGGEALRCLHALDDPRGCGFGGFCRDCVIRNMVLDTLENRSAHLQVEASFDFSSGDRMQTLTLLVSTIPITFQGENMSLVTIMDITERKLTEEAIDNERAYLSAVIDNIEEAIVICDAEGRIVRFNETARYLHGLPEQPIPSDQWARHYDLYQVDGITPLPTENIPLFRAMRGERVQNAEIVVAPKHRPPYFLICNGQALTDETGKIYGAVVAMHDITERKLMEVTLRRERDLTQRYLDTTQTIMVALDTEGRITMINRSGCELLGYAEDEILGCNWFETCLPQPEGTDNVLPVFLRIMSGDLSSAEYFENSVVCKDGTQRLIGWHNAFLEDDDGRVFGTLSSGEDITERKQAEQQLRANEEKYRVLVENANEGIFVTQDEKMKFINPETENITGFSKEELIEKPFADLLHPEDRDMVLDRHRKRLSGGGDLPGIYSFRVINKAGEALMVELSTVLFNWEDRPATLNFIRDLTWQKKLEAQLRQSQKMEAIGTLAGGIAHDFNNILSSIIGYTELSLDEVEKGSLLHQNLCQLLTAGNRARDLVKQILTISRQEEQVFKPIPIVPLVKEPLKMLRSTFPSFIEIRENISTEQGIVYADPTQLHQVIVNLATNAKQAMGDEGGILEVSVKTMNFDDYIGKKYPGLAPGNYVQITVSDTGCGISKQYIDRIFEPYFTTSEPGKGTGLGLSVVHGIVKAHKGHITVYSEPGKGTKFHVYLPLAQQQRSRTASIVQENEALPTGEENILVVDDEKPIVQMLQQTLEGLGYMVTSRTSSVEALEAFRANPDKFDIVITDMTMPEMTGDRLVLKIKEIRPDMPVILCTGFSEKMDAQKKGELGIEDYMLKPFPKTDLAKTIRKILDES